jgi:hypothetical protein
MCENSPNLATLLATAGVVVKVVNQMDMTNLGNLSGKPFLNLKPSGVDFHDPETSEKNFYCLHHVLSAF